ncbi:MAG: type II toxin-antitoxin system RelE/ParE family toxin [Pseudomonadota bacterium]
MNIRFHETALRDLTHIRDTISEDDPRAAENMLLRIDHSIALLEKFPQLGRPGHVAGTREKPVPRTPYIVVYEQVDEFDLWILTIIHSRQQYPPE